MPLFKDKEQEKSRVRAKLLGATALGTGAILTDYPTRKAVEALDRYTAAIDSQRTQVLDAKMRSELIDSLLDKKLRNLPVVIDPSLTGARFVMANSNFAPTREVAMKAVEGGGVTLAGGEKLPMSRFIKNTRDLGGYVALAPGQQYIPTLAHELGHAAILSGNHPLRSSAIFRGLDTLGRKAITNIPVAGGAAALAAMSMDSDNSYRYAIPGALLATQLPVLYEEGAASLSAMKALNGLNNKMVMDAITKAEAPVISKETLDMARKSLRAGFGTYAAGAAGLLAAPLLAMKTRSIIDSITDE